LRTGHIRGEKVRTGGSRTAGAFVQSVALQRNKAGRRDARELAPETCMFSRYLRNMGFQFSRIISRIRLEHIRNSYLDVKRNDRIYFP